MQWLKKCRKHGVVLFGGTGSQTSLLYQPSSAHACPSFRYKTGHWGGSKEESGKNFTIEIRLLHNWFFITFCHFNNHFLCPIQILPLNDTNASRGRCFLCLSIVSFLISICVGACYLKITMYKYSSHWDGCQGWIGTDSGLVCSMCE